MSPEFPVVQEPLSINEEQVVLDNLMKDAKEEPAEVIEIILASTAPPPARIEGKHSELEPKSYESVSANLRRAVCTFPMSLVSELCILQKISPVNSRNTQILLAYFNTSMNYL